MKKKKKKRNILCDCEGNVFQMSKIIGFIPVMRLKVAAITGSDFSDSISGWWLLCLKFSQNAVRVVGA